MGFFDLNIPYNESERHKAETTKPSSKSQRLKLVVKAMELGYSGAAYNYTIKGIMNESHRCSIPFFPLPSIRSLSPFFSSSVNFHRNLLNVPGSTPFRQYTRLTVVVDTPSKSAALNNSNSILKTYDIVAVRPLNQMSFEYACQTAEVDIISIDFSDKLPFRLKQPFVRAAIERGVYFEIVYSPLVLEAQVRRQMISNSKLLVEWTRGKNLIISSGAPSLTELRGPYDVANLSSLLGLTLERAKAAISKNCRSLIANALRRKHYVKKAMKVEVLPPDGQIDSDDWLKWDPISGDEGELLLDDTEKSLSTSCNASKTAKAVDFTSALNGLPSHGLLIKDVIPVMPGPPEPPNIGESSLTAQKFEVGDSVYKVSERPSNSSSPPKDFKLSLHNVSSENHASGGTYALTCSPDKLINAEESDHAVINELGCSEQSGHTEREPNNLQVQSLTATSAGDAISLDDGGSNSCPAATDEVITDAVNFTPNSLNVSAFNCKETILSNVSSVDLCTEDIIDEEVLAGTARTANGELSSTSVDMPLSQGFVEREELLEAKDSSVNTVDELPVKESCDQMIFQNGYSAPDELAPVSHDMSLHDSFLDRGTVVEASDCSASAADESSIKGSYNQMQIENGYSVAKDELMEDMTGEKMQMEDQARSSFQLPVESPSGRGRGKRSSRRISLHPFKRLLSPKPSMKKSRKLKPFTRV